MCFFSIVTRFLIIVFGILRPARCTHRVLDDMELASWAKYWIVYASLVCLELVGDTFFAWMPLYAESKLLIVLWLIVSAPQASVWVFDTILNPLVNQHMPRIDHFLMHGKRHLLGDVLRFTSELSKHSLKAVLPVVSQIWKKSPGVHTDDSIAELNTNRQTNEETNTRPDEMQPVVDNLPSSYSGHYYDTNAEEEYYEVTFPPASSQSQSQTHVSQRKKNLSKPSLPELAKKIATQLSSPPSTRPKRKQYVYDMQFDDATLKTDSLLDVEEALQSQQIPVDRSHRQFSSRKEHQRYQ
ncbi:receptor expression-enhancing protein 3 [Drosophila innubila]|uniref:receptor expression-enhancing protein 3 n=1 Tax=Drosophila innubila TaxID=198719 RepID=UPI00148D37A8|nr:receptor expression-enhancing protein 3 [Drosophila innubila]